jgi:AmmeMemoRadiSam system protein A
MDIEILSDEMSDQLTSEEKQILLQLARKAIEEGVRGLPIPHLELKSLPSRLQEHGATFVTLNIDKELRGCIGALEATRPLAEDVQIHAVAAALEDYRFPPLQPEEVSLISIEISRLTAPQHLEFDNPENLLSYLRPGIDGVVLMEGIRRATFLPQVWEKVPDPEMFLEMLCRKMGASSDYWRRKGVQVFTYQVEKFYE